MQVSVTAHTREALPPSVHPFFKVCSRAKSSLRTGRDRYFCSGGVFPDTVCAMPLENQLIMSSGFVSVGLDRRTKSSWALAHDSILCRNLKLSLLILSSISFMKSLGTNSRQDLGLWACVAPTGVCGEGLICCSLQDDLAIPCFLKLSHCLLRTPAINSSWVGAKDVFFPGRSPNQAVKHLTIKHGTPGRGHGQREGICWLCIV